MYLTLEVVSPQAASLGAQRRQVVGPRGLTIGRAPGNDWVIPDPYVSKQHARIVCTDGRFFVEGLGKNPIALGSADNVIPTSQRHPLDSGDRLFIDQYEILVTALPGDPPGDERAVAEPAEPPDLFLASTPTPIVESAGPAAAVRGTHGPVIPDVWSNVIPDPDAETAELDPLHALGDNVRSVEVELPPVNWQQASPLGDHYQPPPPVQGIPENWARSILVPRPALPKRQAAPPPPARANEREPVPAGTPVEPAPSAQAPPTQALPPAIPADLTALLRAAGLPDRDLSPEVVQELGKVLRVVVEGVMEVLQGRAEIKSQFRLPVTRVQARENNPLKLSPNVESALHTLLVQRNPGYLPTVQAFEDAFADIRNHQLAMLEGVRVAFESMLGAFDPRQMEQDFERTVKRGGLLGGLSGKSRYWELYTERFTRLGRDADDTFRRLFGNVFAEAYEMQLEQLKKERP
jgi:type VI secretion system FHA domain protein